MDYYTWTGAVDGDLDKSGNYDPATVPTNADHLTIPVGATQRPTGGTSNALFVVIAGTVNAGTYNGSVTVNWNGVLSGGTFNGSILDSGLIDAGTYGSQVIVESEISGGTFSNCTIRNYGHISGGTYVGTLVIEYPSTINGTPNFSGVTSLKVKDSPTFSLGGASGNGINGSGILGMV